MKKSNLIILIGTLVAFSGVTTVKASSSVNGAPNSVYRSQYQQDLESLGWYTVSRFDFHDASQCYFVAIENSQQNDAKESVYNTNKDGKVDFEVTNHTSTFSKEGENMDVFSSQKPFSVLINSDISSKTITATKDSVDVVNVGTNDDGSQVQIDDKLANLDNLPSHYDNKTTSQVCAHAFWYAILDKAQTFPYRDQNHIPTTTSLMAAINNYWGSKWGWIQNSQTLRLTFYCDVS